MNLKRVAVLLTVHNRKEKTLKCLQYLYQQLPIDGYDIDTYLTDDGCTDGTPDAIRKEFSQVKIIKGNGSLFWNRGMYVAWREAEKSKEYDYYLWLNDDTFLFDDSLIRLLYSSIKNKNKAIVIGSCCDSQNKHSITYGGYNICGELIINVQKEQKCVYFNGNIVLIPRYVYNILGKNDPVFHHSVGDFDYGCRAKESKINNIVAEGVFGICNRHERLPVWADPQKNMITRLKSYFNPHSSTFIEYFIYCRRHFGLAKATKTFVTSFLHTLMPRLYLIIKHKKNIDQSI